jgi:hypothetical protein
MYEILISNFLGYSILNSEAVINVNFFNLQVSTVLSLHVTFAAIIYLGTLTLF